MTLDVLAINRDHFCILQCSKGFTVLICLIFTIVLHNGNFFPHLRHEETEPKGGKVTYERLQRLVKSGKPWKQSVSRVCSSSRMMLFPPGVHLLWNNKTAHQQVMQVTRRTEMEWALEKFRVWRALLAECLGKQKHFTWVPGWDVERPQWSVGAFQAEEWHEGKAMRGTSFSMAVIGLKGVKGVKGIEGARGGQWSSRQERRMEPMVESLSFKAKET